MLYKKSILWPRTVQILRPAGRTPGKLHASWAACHKSHTIPCSLPPSRPLTAELQGNYTMPMPPCPAHFVACLLPHAHLCYMRSPGLPSLIVTGSLSPQTKLPCFVLRGWGKQQKLEKGGRGQRVSWQQQECSERAMPRPEAQGTTT